MGSQRVHTGGSHHTEKQTRMVSSVTQSVDAKPYAAIDTHRQTRGKTVICTAPISHGKYTGRITWFRGTFGWVDCDEVQAKHDGRQVFLHWNDCTFDCPKQWDEIDFQVAYDSQGNPKAVNATRHRADEPEQINARDWFELRKKR